MRVNSSYYQDYCFKTPYQNKGVNSAHLYSVPMSFCALQNTISVKKIGNFINEISKDRLELHLKKLTSAEMEGRALGHPGIERAKEYIAEQFKEIGLESVKPLGLKDYYHKYEAPAYQTSWSIENGKIEGQIWHILGSEKAEATNVIGMIKGHKYPKDYLILSAHYDHLGQTKEGHLFPGADDNASSVSAMIEIARAMKKNKNEKSVIFVATSGEEAFKTGAHNLSSALKKSGMAKNVEIIDIEMLGAQKGNTLDIFKYKAKWCEKITESIKEACNFMGIKAKSHIPRKGAIRNNAEAFTNDKLPAVCVAWDFFGKRTHPYFHTTSDTFENLNMNTIERAAKTVGAASYIHSNKAPSYVEEKQNVINKLQNIIRGKDPQKVA